MVFLSIFLIFKIIITEFKINYHYCLVKKDRVTVVYNLVL
jgi:hypothetical protein